MIEFNVFKETEHGTETVESFDTLDEAIIYISKEGEGLMVDAWSGDIKVACIDLS